MAYQLEDEEQQPQGAGRAVAGGGRGPQAPRGQTPGRGTGFVNLERVFNLNRPKAEAFATQRTGAVRGQLEGAQKQAQGFLGGFQAKVDAGVTARPTSWAKSDTDATHAREMEGRGYSGPDDVTQEEGYADASRAIRDSQESVAGLTSQGGREAEAGRRGLNAGESQLSAWLQGRAGGEQFQSVADSFPGLSSMLGVGAQKSLDAAKARSASAQGAWGVVGDKYDNQKAAAGARTEAEAKRKADATARGEAEAKQAVEDAEVWKKLAVKDNFLVAKELTPGFGQTQADIIAEIEADPKRQEAIDKYHGPGTWAAIRRHLARTKNTALAATNGGVAGGRV